MSDVTTTHARLAFSWLAYGRSRFPSMSARNKPIELHESACSSTAEDDPQSRPRIEAFLPAMKKGWTNGGNVRIETRHLKTAKVLGADRTARSC